jgi:hypothetical protein
MSPKRTSRDLGLIEELLSRVREPWWKSKEPSGLSANSRL